MVGQCHAVFPTSGLRIYERVAAKLAEEARGAGVKGSCFCVKPACLQLGCACDKMRWGSNAGLPDFFKGSFIDFQRRKPPETMPGAGLNSSLLSWGRGR